MHRLLKSVAKKIFDFDGRATRKEFWIDYGAYFLLFFSVILISNEYLGLMIVFIMVLMFIPLWSVQVRRLHDIGFSGYWILFVLFPPLGLILFIFACFPSQKGTNKYGPNPYQIN